MQNKPLFFNPSDLIVSAAAMQHYRLVGHLGWNIYTVGILLLAYCRTLGIAKGVLELF